MNKKQKFFMSDEALEHIQDLEDGLCGDEFENIDEMREAYTKKYPSSKCNNSWFRDCVSFTCEECRLQSNACICYDCFKRSDHTGHNIKIHLNQTGNCDCGDTMFWKESHFCTKHKAQSEHPEELLSKEEQSMFFTTFSTAAAFLTDATNEDALFIIQWLKNFTSFGDPVLRCLSMALCPCLTGDLHLRLTGDALSELLSLESEIINEIYFVKTFLPYLLTEIPKFVSAPIREENEKLATFVFHCYSYNVVKTAIKNHTWLDMITDMFDAMHKLHSRIKTRTDYARAAIYTYSSEFVLFVDRIIKLDTITDDERKKVFRLLLNFVKRFDYIGGFNRIPTGDKVDDDNENPLLGISYQLLQVSQYLEETAAYADAAEWLGALYDNSLTVPDLGSNNCPANPKNTVYVAQFLASCTYKVIVKEDNLPALFEKVAKSRNITVDQLAIQVAKLPMRAFVAHYYADRNYFVRNESTFQYIFSILQQEFFLKKIWVPMFGIVQICAGIMSADNFINLVQSTFEVDPEPNNIIHFLTSIALDRVCLEYDGLTMMKALLFGLIREEPRPLDYVLRRIHLEPTKYDKNLEIKNLCIKYDVDNVTYIRLKDENCFTYYTPCFTIPLLRKMISKFTSKNKASLIPLTIQDDMKGLKLLRYVFTRYWNENAKKLILYGDTELTHYLLPVFVYKSQKGSEIIANEPQKELFDTNLKDLFLSQNDGELFKAVAKIGIPGEECLKRLNIGEIKPNENAENEKKKIAAEMRRRAMQDILKQQKQFFGEDFDNDYDDDADDEICPICQLSNQDTEKPVGFPVLAIPGKTIDTEIQHFRYFACNHHIHIKCETKAYFDCPLDRGHCNTICPLLPAMADECMIADYRLIHECNEFVRCIGSPRLAFDGVLNEISILEQRHILNPNCFDRYNFTGLRNIWRAIRCHITHIDGYVDAPLKIHNLEIPSIRLHDFYMKILNLRFEEAKSVFDNLILDYIKEYENPEGIPMLVRLLRRAIIFRHYILDMPVSDESDIDWDEVLSGENIIKIFNLPHELHELIKQHKPKAVDLNIPLPQNIMDLMEPPYNINIALSKRRLLTVDGDLPGKIYTSEEFTALVMQPFRLCMGICSDFLCGFYILGYGSEMSILSPYVNKYGDQDVGLSQGYPLTLDEARYDKLRDIWFGMEFARSKYETGFY